MKLTVTLTFDILQKVRVRARSGRNLAIGGFQGVKNSKLGDLVLKFANEENTCPYSANLLGSCESVRFYRHRVLKAAQFAAANVPIQQPTKWGKNWVLPF